ncbi:Protein of unknown function [Lactobacillus helveticus CIRM-BIA 953]|uniref:Uncharacterized protein n=1 Tax=Lactobacillus helveticus CIRM-BIA 953 TaxID=1226335 RepID=U4QN64_LACHE|nr:Protein of unknown function [Lactobacillus helveticus CIRM-BIA 953]
MTIYNARIGAFFMQNILNVALS